MPRPISFRFGILALLVLSLAASPSARDEPPATRAASPEYETRKVVGWTVVVSRDLLKREPDLAARTLARLAHQLDQIVWRVPAAAVKKLKTVRIWVEEAEPHHPCMAYHPDPNWLQEHDMSPEKARCVEIANARNFLSWTKEQPWMVLHELAHAYHHQMLPRGFENPEVRAAFDRAMTDKLYDSVLRGNGKEERAYAATNPMEYFAEVSEAYFGTNDFYPFVSAELKRHDAEVFGLLAKLWEE